MKQVWVNFVGLLGEPLDDRGAALPTLVTAMPEPKSMSRLPSTSTRSAPSAWSTYTGSVTPNPRATAERAPRAARPSVVPGRRS